nr:hypothetical protein [Leptolyngbya sp. FACHB-261]
MTLNQQFLGTKGFVEVGISPGILGAHLVTDLIIGCQQNNGQRVTRRL